MDNKDNLNYIIEQNDEILGTYVSKFSLILAIIIQLLIFGALFIPLIILVNWLTSLITIGMLSIINIFLTINWPFLDNSIYEILFSFIKYKSDFQKVKTNKLIEDKIVLNEGNTIAFIFENKLIIKSYFEISLRQLTSQNQIDEAINEFQTLLQESNFRAFSINSNFNVNSNLDKFSDLIKQEIDFEKDDVLGKNINKLLIQQFSDFISLNETMDSNNINVVEFSREYAIDKGIKIDFTKPFYKTILQSFKIEETSFRNSINSYIQIKDLNKTYLNSIKKNILLFKNEDIEFKPNYFITKNTNLKNATFNRILKLNSLSPQLNPFYLFNLLNNKFNYETCLTFCSLNEKEENNIFTNLEKATNDNKVRSFKFKKFKRASTIRKELTSQILFDQMTEIEYQDQRSKGLSFLIKVTANNQKELVKKIKELKSTLKSKKVKFLNLFSLQKQAYFDFHIGIENKLKKNGKERKNRFRNRKLNNVNSSTIWLTANTAAWSLPFKESIDIEPTGWIYGNDLSNNPIGIDFDLNRPNHHIMILGKSGSGKTTAAEYLLNQKLIDKQDKKSIVIVMDPKNEYETLVSQYEGQTFNIAKGFANPFKRNTKEINEDDLENIEMFLSNLLDQLKIDKASLLPRLLNLIFNSKEWKNNEYDFDTLIKQLDNSLELKEKLGLEQYLNIYDYLFQYSSKGIKSHLFNQNININIDKKIISFNFSKLISTGVNNDTNTLIFSVLGFLNNLMRKNNPKFKEQQRYSITILIDEFHLFLNSQNTSIIKQFDTLFAISRSFDVGIIAITQNLENLNNISVAHHSRSIFANTAYFIAFQHDATQYEHLIRLLPEHIVISNEEKTELLSNKKHQSLVFFNNQKKFLKWKLGLFYDEKRDENTDGLKQIRVSEYNQLKNICDEYIELKQEELKNKNLNEHKKLKGEKTC